VIDSKDLACKKTGNMAANSLEVTEVAQQVGQGQKMSTVADIVLVALHERAAIRSEDAAPLPTIPGPERRRPLIHLPE
jgi:hypothetical protein